MNLKKTFLPVIVLGITVTAGISGAYLAHAQSGEANISIVEMIAQKFNLDKNEVNKVFEQHRQEGQAEHMKEYESFLSDAVSEGKISEDQKKLILEKRNSMQEQNRESMKNLSPDERRTKMNKNREEWEKWAKDNNIDESLLHPGFGHKGRMGHGNCADKQL